MYYKGFTGRSHRIGVDQPVVIIDAAQVLTVPVNATELDIMRRIVRAARRQREHGGTRNTLDLDDAIALHAGSISAIAGSVNVGFQDIQLLRKAVAAAKIYRTAGSASSMVALDEALAAYERP